MDDGDTQGIRLVGREGLGEVGLEPYELLSFHRQPAELDQSLKSTHAA